MTTHPTSAHMTQLDLAALDLDPNAMGGDDSTSLASSQLTAFLAEHGIVSPVKDDDTATSFRPQEEGESVGAEGKSFLCEYVRSEFLSDSPIMQRSKMMLNIPT